MVETLEDRGSTGPPDPEMGPPDPEMGPPDPEMGDAERLFARLRENTLDPPGVTRATYGPGETAAHRLVAERARAIDLEVTTDYAGNLYMTLPGRDRAAPAVMIGSHHDGGADREVAHEVADHDAGGDPLKETVAKEERPQGPHEPGQKTYGRRPAAGVATPHRPPIPSAP